jgi:MFS transporter, PAT family, solute carrier family 33 (acetyl-CoA transportor), member 1
MSFYSKVSDSAMGGTYMTLLNTVSNLGYKWCETATMFAIDAVSVKQCVGGGGEALGSCAAEAAKHACVAAGNECVAADGPFHAAVCLTPVVAFAWLRVAGKHIDRLQKGGKAKWKVRKNPGR